MTESTEHTYRVQIQDQGLTDDIRDFLRAGAPGTSATSAAVLTADRCWFVAQGLSRRDAQTLRRQLDVLGLRAEVEPDVSPQSAPSDPDADPWGAVLGTSLPIAPATPSTPSPPQTSTPSPPPSSAPPSPEPFDWLPETLSPSTQPSQPTQPPSPDPISPPSILTSSPALTPPPQKRSLNPTTPQPTPQQKKPIALPALRTSAPTKAESDDAPTPWVFGVASLLVPGWGLTLLGRPAEGFRFLVSAPLIVPWSRSVLDAYRRAQSTDHPPEVPWGPALAHLGAWVGVLAALWLLLPSAPPSNAPVIDVRLNPIDEAQDPPDPDEQTPDEQTPNPTAAPLNPTSKPAPISDQTPPLTQVELAAQLKRANTLLADAESACDANDISRCVALLEQVIQLDPTRRRAYELLARARTLTASPEPAPEPLPPDLLLPDPLLAPPQADTFPP